MTSHPEAGGLAINWCIFGSNGHRTKPDGGVLRNFTRRAKDNDPSNIACKTICDTNKIFTAGVHYPILYCKGFYTLDENGDIIDTPWPKQVHFDKIRINHYFIKSYEEFKAKRARGRGTNPGLYGMDFFDRFDKNEVVDTEILSHI